MRLLAGLAFLLSGAAALLYQVAWQRILALHTGVGIESVAVIVAAFMAGLGLGSLAGGLLSPRLRPFSALLAFAALEVLVGAYGAASGTLLYDVLYRRASWLYAPAWRGALMHFATLLLPTVLMGMSLPFLVRALVRDVRVAGRTIAVLYGVNVIGASLGALLAPWVFIRLYGIRGALFAAALSNLAAAVAALLLAAVARRDRDVPETRAPAPAGEPPEPLGRLALLYALSGFIALSLELLWFRVIEVAVKSTAYTFGTVLAVYLGGIGAGSLAGAWYAPRLRRPLRAFLLSQCLLLALSGVGLALLVALPGDLPGLRWYSDLWATRRSFNLGGAWSWPAVLRLYLALPLALFGLPAALMGFSFMALQTTAQDEVRTSGRKVGLLQAANLVGCLAGCLAFGLGALHRLGSLGSLRLLLACGLVFAVLGGLRVRDGRRAFVVAGVALTALLVGVPDSRALWLRLHGLSDARVMIGEDATGVAAISPLDEGEPGAWRVWVSGRHHSRLPFGGIHTALGAIPALIHPSPAEAAVIGLGSGDTAWAAGCRREATRQVTVFEICAPQVRLLRQVAALPEPPAKLPRFLADPRLRFVVADGRNALERSAASFDVIEMDALFPTSPYSGNLYSVEFYALCARRLRPGGLMCTWAPTARVRASFARAFPYVLEFGDGVLLVGSRERIPLDLPAWRDRVRSPAVRAYLGEGRAEEVLAVLRTARPLTPPQGVSVNHDLFPRDEFNVR